MRGMEAYVTSSVSDKDAVKALVLARSLRRATTTKPIIVLVSPQLSAKYRYLLEKAFDQVVCIDQHHSLNGWIGLRNYAKLYSFNLTIFRKCVYLAPEALVLKNSDEIFEACSGNDFNAGMKKSIGGNGWGIDTNVMCFSPSTSVFQHLMLNGKQIIGKEKDLTFDAYFNNWLMNQKGFGKLDDKYHGSISVDSMSTGDFSIATLSEDFSEKILTLEKSKQLRAGGIMESVVTKYWKMVYEQDILPKLAGGVDNHWASQVAPMWEDSGDLLDSIAIVGISCRHPGANNLDEFWDMLIKGHSGIRPVPSDRWTKEHGCKASPAYESTLAGFLSQEVDLFDGKLFGISRTEMEFLDPQQRLLLEVTWEALENAAIDPLSLYKSHTGVFVGAWMNDYKDLLAMMGCDEFYRIYMGNSLGSCAARISYILGLTAPSVGTESGCSSAMVAVDLACKSLRNGDTNMALACGVNLLLSPFNKDTMSFIIAEDGRCKTFDAEANGFGRAEGVATLVLKRYVDAVKDGDNIWALIRGSSCVQEGPSRSMGTPTKECEALAMRLALKDARVHPKDISFVEAHGTGTALGDPLEISAIAEVYGGHDRDEPLIVGSVKTNIGHTESCSGITGIIKVVASLQHEIIPQHLNLTKLNPKIDLEAIPAVIPMKPLPWKKNQLKPRLAGVSSFGITGTDGHLIIQEAPQEHISPIKPEVEKRSLHLLKLSARTEEALDAVLAQYQTFLGEPSKNFQFSDICYTANIGRASFPHRAVILAGDSKEAANIILSKKYSRNEIPEGAHQEKICFLFTGQGSQYPEMSKQLYESSPVFRMHFDKCQQILQNNYAINIKQAMWNGNELHQTLYSQTGIFCVEYALLKLWESWGVKPDYVLGHSLGEFCAAVAANILSLEDALMLVAERSRLVQGLSKGKMLVVKGQMHEVDGILKEYSKGVKNNFWLDYAAINSPEQTVLAGTPEHVEAFGEFCSREKSLKTFVLDASHAFHSRLMDPILQKYGKITGNLRRPQNFNGEEDLHKCKYVSGVYGRIVEDGPGSALYTPKYWVAHTREKVNFIEACQTVAAEDCKYFLEIGPQPILSALVSANNNGRLTCIPSLRRNEENWKTILGSLSKLYLNGWTINWKNFDKFYSRKKLPALPTYPFQRKKYWFDAQSLQGQNYSSSIHPLLGSIFPNASGVKIFQSMVDVKKKVEWIKDHCVGQRVIFPGAAFLEMCLSAGHCATEGLTDTFCKPSGPVTIENLKILAPLAVNERQACRLQVVLDNSSEGMKVQVYKQHATDGEAPKWTEHCVSYFTPATVDFDEAAFRDQFNFTRILEDCQRSEMGIGELYGKLAEVGLKFGPAFQSLSKVWKGENGILAEAKVPQDWRDYIVHPVLLDAMLQAAMVVQSRGDVKKLHVPIEIKKFSWLQHDTHDNTTASSFIIYSCHTDANKDEGEGETGKEIISILFDGTNGKIIGFMSGMTFAETSVQAIEDLLESQEADIPTLHSEVWKPSMGPNQNRINIWDTLRDHIFNQDVAHQFFKDSNSVAERDWDREDSLEKLCYSHLLKAYYALGWDPQPGDTFTLDKFMFQLQISTEHRKLVRYQMTMLEREGILKFISDLELQVINLPPTLSQVHDMIDNVLRILEKFDNMENSIQIYTKCGQNLAPILQGKESALTILFPQDPSKPSAESFYTEAYSYNNVDVKTVNNLKYLVRPMDPDNSKQGVMRILEVGAGTGNFTEAILKTFMEQGIEVEYTFTDISPAFFINAGKKFEEHKDRIKYQVLNLEDDAKSQGFSPQHYDVILGADVIHATKDLSESISNLRQLLRPHGLLLLIEGERQNHITCIFGLLNGYWRFVDTNIRQHHPLVSGDTWRELCLNLGFDKIVVIPCSNHYCNFIIARATNTEMKISRPIAYSSGGKWIVFPNMDNESKFIISKLALYRTTITVWKSINFQESSDGLGFGININNKEHMAQLFSAIKRQSSTSHIEGLVFLWGMAAAVNTDQSELSQPFLHLCQTVMELKQKQLPKFFLVTKGVFPIGDHLCGTPSSSALWGMAKSCSNEINMKIKMIDLCPTDNDGLDNSKDAFYEFWNDTSDLHIAYRERTRYFGRLIKTKMTEKALKLPQCDRFQLVLPQSKAISDLKFGPLGKYALKSTEIEIRVMAAALNFRDVFAVMKPDPQFENINVVGSDFAGTVCQVGSQVTKWKVGDSVFGCNLDDGALPSHVRIVEEAVVKMPNTFTFAEAATLPAVFATAYYSLITVAKMKRGDTVLIHTASGGVGLSAIQICQHIGVNIIATAGSARKRAYLKSLGILHVFHSRNTKYEEAILKVTSGRGVNLVLNSLTGPGFKEASLHACSKDARFVEMSKLSIWTPEEVKLLRPDVDYTIVDLTSVSRDIWAMLFETLDKFLQTGVGKPIPYVRFDGIHIREALTFLQKAKHIGKIVCVMPETKFQAGQYVHETPLFSPNSTYLITGGLGGIGFEVCKWMVAQGARNLIIVSRSQPKEKHLQVIKSFRSQGINMLTKAVDVGDYAMCKTLMNYINEPANNLPPLRGIMHAAGVLSDATLINQSWDKYLQAFRPKVKGAWNLHELTKSCRLEHFVMFSSMAALFGPPGQSNHAACNAYLDGLTCHRESIGLPAVTVNWGQWGQVGVAAGREVRGVLPFSSQRGLAALEAILKSQRSQICVVDLELPVLMKVHSQMKAYLQNMTGGSSSDHGGVAISIKSEKFWEEVDQADEGNKRDVIKQYVKVLLRLILKLDDEEPIDDTGNFQDMGLDSLMMIELKNNLQAVLGSRMTLAASALADCHNIQLLTDKLIQQMEEQGDADKSQSNESQILSPEEMSKLIEEDCQLPENLQQALETLAGKPISKLSLARTFLLTGVTGKLGPYMLKELLTTQSNVDKVYCLIRSTATASQRFHQSLKETEIDTEIDLTKVQLLPGDLASPQFGLEDKQWDLLAQEVDAVINCAVKSHHVEVYGLTEMRAVNVDGVKNVLEFCCHLKTKHLFNSSSIVGVASTDEDGCLSEEWPTEGELDGVTDLGYPITKFIGDRLVHKAVQQGLPAKSFRFGGLIGNSKTGRFKHLNNHIMLRFLCYMKLGAMPSVPVPAFLLPVDIAAKHSMKIWLEEDQSIAPYSIYNVCHPNPALEQEFPVLAKEFGFDVDVVDYVEFVNKFANEGEDSLLYPFRSLYENEERYNSLMSFPDAIRKWLENPDNFFSVRKVTKVIPDYAEGLQSTWDYVRRDLAYAKSTGLFDKFRLTSRN